MEKDKKLHMFWQPATLIKGGRGFVPLFFWLIVDIKYLGFILHVDMATGKDAYKVILETTQIGYY